jgi:hypothetical protein
MRSLMIIRVIRSRRTRWADTQEKMRNTTKFQWENLYERHHFDAPDRRIILK